MNECIIKSKHRRKWRWGKRTGNTLRYCLCCKLYVRKGGEIQYENLTYSLNKHKRWELINDVPLLNREEEFAHQFSQYLAQIKECKQNEKFYKNNLHLQINRSKKQKQEKRRENFHRDIKGKKKCKKKCYKKDEKTIEKTFLSSPPPSSPLPPPSSLYPSDDLYSSNLIDEINYSDHDLVDDINYNKYKNNPKNNQENSKINNTTKNNFQIKKKDNGEDNFIREKKIKKKKRGEIKGNKEYQYPKIRYFTKNHPNIPRNKPLFLLRPKVEIPIILSSDLTPFLFLKDVISDIVPSYSSSPSSYSSHYYPSSSYSSSSPSLSSTDKNYFSISNLMKKFEKVKNKNKNVNNNKINNKNNNENNQNENTPIKNNYKNNKLKLEEKEKEIKEQRFIGVIKGDEHCNRMELKNKLWEIEGGYLVERILSGAGDTFSFSPFFPPKQKYENDQMIKFIYISLPNQERRGKWNCCSWRNSLLRFSGRTFKYYFFHDNYYDNNNEDYAKKMRKLKEKRKEVKRGGRSPILLSDLRYWNYFPPFGDIPDQKNVQLDDHFDYDYDQHIDCNYFVDYDDIGNDKDDDNDNQIADNELDNNFL